MSPPQIIILCLVLYDLIKNFVNEGKLKPRKNFYLVAPLALIEVGALSWGGFFIDWNWPQTVFVIVWLFSISYQAFTHDTLDGSKYSIWASLMSVVCFYLPLLWVGNFFR